MCWEVGAMASKPKFRVWQVVAFRDERGGWDYDRIRELRPAAAKEHNELAMLERSSCRIETHYLRPLTKREAGK